MRGTKPPIVFSNRTAGLIEPSACSQAVPGNESTSALLLRSSGIPMVAYTVPRSLTPCGEKCGHISADWTPAPRRSFSWKNLKMKCVRETVARRQLGIRLACEHMELNRIYGKTRPHVHRTVGVNPDA
jgi:hypothetical protein